MLFTVRECGKGAVVHGLDRIEIGNASLLMLAPDQPLGSLDVGDLTIGRRNGNAYEIVRVA